MLVNANLEEPLFASDGNMNPFLQLTDRTTIYSDMWLVLLVLTTRTVPFHVYEYAMHSTLLSALNSRVIDLTPHLPGPSCPA